MLFPTIATSALLLTQSASALTWSWVKSGQTCAGIYTNCNSTDTCTTTGVGPCSGDTPKEYLESHFVGMAFVKESDYLSNTASIYDISPSGKGFRDFDGKKTTPNGGQYAYTMTGNYFGDGNAGGYIGIASYLNTGSSEIKATHNDVYIASTQGANRVTRGASDLGAPEGPYTVCIADKDNCGKSNQRTFKSGEYKFSIFGGTFGTNYANTVVAGQNGFPAGMTHIGVRMKLKATGFDVMGLRVNGAAYDAANVNKDVTKMTIAHGAGELTLDFPTKYNTGSSASATVGTPLTVDATKTVQIRVHSADKAKGEVLIDYLFHAADLNAAGKYFMYDPSVTGSVSAVKAASLGYSLSSLLVVCVTLFATLM